MEYTSMSKEKRKRKKIEIKWDLKDEEEKQNVIKLSTV